MFSDNQNKRQKEQLASRDLGPLGAESFEDHLLNFFITQSIPFAAISNINLYRAVQSLDATVELPSAQTLRRRLEVKVCEVKEEIKNILRSVESRISLSCDCWSSEKQSHAFFGVIAHYIDRSWEYREVVIGFIPVGGKSKTGAGLAQALWDLVGPEQDGFDIADRLFAITADNASNNQTMIVEFEAMMNQFTKIASEKAPNRPAVEQFEDWVQPHDRGRIIIPVRHPCLAHVIQLAVNAAATHLKIQSPKKDISKWYDSKEAERALDQYETSIFAKAVTKVSSL